MEGQLLSYAPRFETTLEIMKVFELAVRNHHHHHHHHHHLIFKLKIFGALINHFNNVVFSLSRESVPAGTCNFTVRWTNGQYLRLL